MVTGDSMGTYSVMNTDNDWNLIRYLENGETYDKRVFCMINDETNEIACLSAGGGVINIFDAYSYEIKKKIILLRSLAHSIFYNEFRKGEVVILTCNRSLQVYHSKSDEYVIKREILNAHEEYLSSVICL